jgi:SAM-dependent methyltransferase
MSGTDYHLAELEIALDPGRPEHLLPQLSSARVGVVDVGCGIGQLFAAKGAEVPPGVPCHAFDIDAAAIEYARRRWPEKAHFAVAPAERLPLPARSVDLYVSRVSLPYTDIRTALAEAARVLEPGGLLWITLHPVSMTVRELAEALGRGRLKEAIRRLITLANGFAFHLCGTVWRLGAVRDSWQSEARMHRELEGEFADVCASRVRGQFLIEARRR